MKSAKSLPVGKSLKRSASPKLKKTKSNGKTEAKKEESIEQVSTTCKVSHFSSPNSIHRMIHVYK
jgi:hypothetical protein